MGDVLKEIVLQDEQTKKIDLALEKIMQNGNGGSKNSMSEANNEDEDEDDDNHDGNEWDE
jgi:hypothetical protein